ncbi:uncharacterized protein LOC105644845 [Jatropha curcas]|uniref:uncharacterized protein LOC105644845 n=1 Tax=Jatropha curcas TaxID=180498 RepID=UPI0018950350|nr:uncharacterized protein LOC105644845 [Jatropha curcas]
MGKLLCDSTAVAETTFQPSSPAIHWRDTNGASLEAVDLVSTTNTTTWDDVIGLEDQQRRHLQKLQAKGVLWKHPGDGDNDSASSSPPRSVVFRLSHGGEVSADGNCLFTASQRAMMAREMDARELRRRTVRRFSEDFGSAHEEDKEKINDAVKHMYSPDLKSGWGIHVVQEVKLLAKKEDRVTLDSAIEELVQLGMQRTHIVSNLAFSCSANTIKVQAHGSDAMVDEDNCVFFLPHRPRSEICELPFFLFMKGTGWCGAGADHYEPLIAHPSSLVSNEKVAVVL